MYTQIQQQTLKLLARKDYTFGELVVYFTKKGFDATQIRQELQLLQDNNWINDRRVADNIIFHYSKIKGVLWLRQKLQRKHIDSEVISQVMEEMSHINAEQLPDYSSLKSAIKNKYKIQSFNQIDPKIKAKVLNYLAYRGFTNVYTMIKNWAEEEL